MDNSPAVRRVAVALSTGFTVLDVYGPVQAFASCRLQTADGGFRRLYEIGSMAERPGIVNSGEGPAPYTEHSFADAPDYDILLAPGDFGTRAAVNNSGFLAQLSTACERARVIATVYTGSALLARTGRLDGRPATSNVGVCVSRMSEPCMYASAPDGFSLTAIYEPCYGRFPTRL